MDAQSAPPEDAAKVEFFETNIRPLLVEHCYSCHSRGSGEANGELLLDSAEGMKRGGTRGRTIAENLDPAGSLLIHAVNYDNTELQMPPAGKLPQNAIDLLKQWIQQGAVDPRVDANPAEAVPLTIAQKGQRHWAYRAPERTDQETIDSLLQKERAKVGLEPNPIASPQALIHRLYNDLHGLPPTYEQVDEFARNYSTPTYEATIDALLASPHFGERMARHWMDVARYADTKGYVFMEDREYAHAWRYRQWLIDSFNNDLSFDRFATLQVAADRMGPADSKDQDAMGFLTLGRRFLNDENDIADDRIDVVTRGFLGLSVACARCHDHKFDPISQADYYSMHSAMVSSREPKDEPAPLRMIDKDQIRPAVVFKRGNPGLGGPTVNKRFVAFLEPVARPLETGSGRLEIAQSIADSRNPLTARVMVNRVWGWMMGAHLVDTPSDFGIRCPEPIQQALLDHMASEFMADGWSVKRLVKRILMSQAYQQSSAISPKGLAADSENRYWWRSQRRRLDFESLRDGVLASCGLLDRTIGGPSIAMIEAPFSNRRTLYARIDRQNLEGVFRSFDFASPDTHVPVRLTTTVPQQGLFLMNSPMIQNYAMEFAKRISLKNQEARGTGIASEQANRDSIAQLFRNLLQRQPTDSETNLALQMMCDMQGSVQGAEVHDPNTSFAESVWADLVQSLACTNEFSFVD